MGGLLNISHSMADPLKSGKEEESVGPRCEEEERGIKLE